MAEKKKTFLDYADGMGLPVEVDDPNSLPPLPPPPADLDFRNRAEEDFRRAKELEAQAAIPDARPKGFKENLINGLRAFMEGWTRPQDPYYMQRERQAQSAADKQSLIERARAATGAGERQQQMGETALLRKVQQDREAREQAEFDINKKTPQISSVSSPRAAVIHPGQENPEFVDTGYVPPDKTTNKNLSETTIMVNGKPEKWAVDMTTGTPVRKIGDAVPTASSAGLDMPIDVQSVDIAARRYLQDGTLPTLTGAAGAKFKQAVLHRASTMDPRAAVAANAANYKASSSALQKIAQQESLVVAFENTARKNLDMAVNAAQHLVDTGSPLLNMPLRSIQTQGLGNEDLTAYQAALRVATNEVARVVNSANTNGVLSDSSRQEFEQIMSPNATLGQIVAAADVLRQDMDNRKQSLAEQRASIQEDLRAVNESYLPPQNPTGATGPAAPPQKPQPPAQNQQQKGPVDKSKWKVRRVN